MKIHWRSGRTILSLAFFVIFYLLVKICDYEHSQFVFLPKVSPNEVWEFVADFSNMKYLNPTITDFIVIEESGNYKHWKYSVEYNERLSHWPYLPNRAIAKYDIKASSLDKSYFIHSVHTTCMFHGLYCLNARSVFKFSPSNSSLGTEGEETVTYQCPRVLSSFCRREVLYQRTAIKENLIRKFTSKVN